MRALGWWASSRPGSVQGGGRRRPGDGDGGGGLGGGGDGDGERGGGGDGDGEGGGGEGGGGGGNTCHHIDHRVSAGWAREAAAMEAVAR